MTSIFTTGAIPTFTKEQQKLRRQAWKPSSIREAMHTSSPVTTIFRSPAAQAEFEARQAAEAAAKAAKRAAAVEKAAATRSAKAKSKKA